MRRELGAVGPWRVWAVLAAVAGTTLTTSWGATGPAALGALVTASALLPVLLLARRAPTENSISDAPREPAAASTP